MTALAEAVATSVATDAMTGAGLTIATVTMKSSITVASGSVISETTAAGTILPNGSSVNLVVSTGPAHAAIPDVVGQDQLAATTAITQGHFFWVGGFKV